MLSLQHILDEKAVMTELDHPNIIKLYNTFKDKNLFYFLLEPALGGELYPHLKRAHMFPRSQARFR
jgi:serine/threonine protein kinase